MPIKRRTVPDQATPPQGEAASATPLSSPGATEGTRTVDIGPLGQMAGYVLRRAQLAVFDDIIRRLAVLELRPAQFSVLVVIDHVPGLSQTEVAEALGIQRANFVALIDGLARRGLALRTTAPQDRRTHALFLTDAGRALLAEARRVHQDHEDWICSRLGPDGQVELLALLTRLVGGGR